MSWGSMDHREGVGGCRVGSCSITTAARSREGKETRTTEKVKGGDAICRGQGCWSQAWAGRAAAACPWECPDGSCLSPGMASAPLAPRPCSSGFRTGPVTPAHGTRDPPALGRGTEAPSNGAQPHMAPWWDTAMEPVPPQHPSSILSLSHRAQPHPHSAHPQPHRSLPAPWSLPSTPPCLSSVSETHPCSTEPISSSSMQGRFGESLPG